MKNYSIVIIVFLFVFSASIICSYGNITNLKEMLTGSAASNSKQKGNNSEKISLFNIPSNHSSKIKMVNNTKSSNGKSVISTKEIGKFTLELINTTGNWGNIEPFFPYMTSNQIKKVVDIYIQITGNAEQAKEDSLMYIGEGHKKYTRKKLTREIVDERALEVLELTANWNYIIPLLPYMTAKAVDESVSLYQQKTGDNEIPSEASSYINKGKRNNKQSNNYILAKQAIDKEGNIDFSMLPSMKKNEVDKLAILYINATEDFSYVYNLRQYMSTKGIDKAVATFMKKVDDYGIVGSMLEFMSNKASKALAEKYFKENKNGEYDWIYEPYLD